MKENIRITPQPPMYTLYATLRDSGEQILMCETTSLKNIEVVLSLFDTGKYIEKFSVLKREENKEQVVHKEKVLKRRI